MNLSIPALAYPRAVTPVAALSAIRYETSGDAQRERDRETKGSLTRGADVIAEGSALFGLGTIVDTLA